MPADNWRGSLEDRLIDHESGVDLDVYVWGAKWHDLHPRARLHS
ncbi:YxiG-like protein [Streptomyces sp. NPDC004779]